jgi:hypothetical protein
MVLYHPMSFDHKYWNGREPSPFVNITKLVLGVNLDNFDVTGTIFFMKPVIFDGIVLGTRSHTFGFQAAESEGTNIVFINGGVEVGVFGDRKTNCFAKLVNLIKEWE